VIVVLARDQAHAKTRGMIRLALAIASAIFPRVRPTPRRCSAERTVMNPQNGYDIEDLSVGMSAEIAKTITDADLVLFAGVSTDVNAVHMDEEFGRTTMFGGRIAHGMLSASLISAVLGNRLPGPGTIYMNQSLRFRAPVRPGDTVRARVTVKEVIEDKCRVVLDTVCTVGDKVVIDGEATLMATSRKKREAGK
jgi:3-hydroxybutyryl-CoA dehydratase